MDNAQAFAGVVVDVLGPSSALDVDEHVGGGVGEDHGNQGVHVAGHMSVREVDGVESAVGVHVDGAHILHVCGVLALARQPDALSQDAVGFVLLGLDVVLEILGHLGVNFVRLFVHVGHPVDHLVHLDNDAGLAVSVSELVLLLASFGEGGVPEDAGLLLVGRGDLVSACVVAVNEGLSVLLVRLLFVIFDEVLERVGPEVDIVDVALLVPDEGRLHVLPTWLGQVAHGGVLQNAAAVTTVVPRARQVLGVGLRV